MSNVKWTDNQKNAITATGGSVLVSAAAGSGKTAVLVQRVIETITSKDNPTPIDRMLIVTFTRAAREEMLSRVEIAIKNLLKQDPHNANLRRQMQLLHNAKITTIDGFCTDFVRQFFYKLDIQQDFQIADEKELSLLKEQALDNTLEYFYNEDNTSFLELVGSMCTYRDDNRLRNNILKLHNFLVTIPFMNSWLDDKLNLYKISDSNSPYIKFILEYVKECVSYCVELNEKAKLIVENDEVLEDKKKVKLKEMLDNDCGLLTLILSKCIEEDFDGIKSFLASLSWSRFPTISGESSSKTQIKSIRDGYKKEISSILTFFKQDLSQIKQESDSIYPLIKIFCDCVKRFHQEFIQLKRDKNLLDFADIENNMINLLCYEENGEIVFTDTAKEISGMFDCIMVDEFQDINQVQNLIFKAISKDENNLFMVGDVKQSIYGFRQASPEIFVSYKEKYPLYNKATDNYPAKIILDKNFRSRESVLNGCNFVFEKLMSKRVGGITYNEEERLNCGNTSYLENENAGVEVMLIDTSLADEDNDDTKVIIEARKVAEKIYKIIYEEKFMVQYKDSKRGATFGDFSILLRTSKGMGRKASLYVDVLNELGIPAIANEKTSIFDFMEIKILLNLLRVIDNPMQDIPLLSVLFSPIFAFTPDDLAQIRCEDTHSPIYTVILKNENNNAKCKKFLDLLRELRTISITTSVDKLIGIILELTSFNSLVMAYNGADTGNIYLLQKYARDYGESGYVSLSSFIKFIDKMQEKGMVLDGSTSDENSALNAVNVMSIHASKGLEFPICFICDTSTSFNLIDVREDMVIDSEAGMGIRYKKDFLKYDTFHRKAISLMKKNTAISEEMRILYVAMTRAKERLIITSGHKDVIKHISSVSSKITEENLSPYVVSNFNSFAQWITACVLLHPSGEQWRKLVDCDIKITQDNSLRDWKLSIIDKDEETEISQSEDEDVVKEKPSKSNCDFLEKVKERINYKYEYEFMTTLPQKVSVSQLAHKDDEVFDKVLKKPAFYQENAVRGTDIGTAFHQFMEFCDLKKARNDVHCEMQRLVNEGFLTKNQSDMVDMDKLKTFIESDLIERVINAEKFYREYRFTSKISSREYDESCLQDCPIILQGAVDLLFENQGSLTLVDYKTDKVKDINILNAIYKKQLLLYKKAIEEIFELPVNEIYIYSVHLNDKIRIDI